MAALGHDYPIRGSSGLRGPRPGPWVPGVLPGNGLSGPRPGPCVPGAFSGNGLSGPRPGPKGPGRSLRSGSGSRWRPSIQLASPQNLIAGFDDDADGRIGGPVFAAAVRSSVRALFNLPLRRRLSASVPFCGEYTLDRAPVKGPIFLRRWIDLTSSFSPQRDCSAQWAHTPVG